jgi:hypothetical protein
MFRSTPIHTDLRKYEIDYLILDVNYPIFNRIIYRTNHDTPLDTPTFSNILTITISHYLQRHPHLNSLNPYSPNTSHDTHTNRTYHPSILTYLNHQQTHTHQRFSPLLHYVLEHLSTIHHRIKLS